MASTAGLLTTSIGCLADTPSVVVIDDDPLIPECIESALEDMDVSTWAARDAHSGMQIVRQKKPFLVFVDMMLGDSNGIDLIEQIHRVSPEISVVMITGNASTSTAVDAIRRGASDYLEKPISTESLREIARLYLIGERNRRAGAFIEAQLASECRFAGVVGRNPGMHDIFSRLKRIAPHFSSALITGETGTGKELIARSLHALSNRPGPLVVFNCAAVAETLFESELFGHAKGAFTGAVEHRKGMIEAAEGGTLFIDEIGEMAPGVQAKLLRFLQNREIQRVGSSVSRCVDVRVVAATHRDLRAMADEGTFRVDLYYRLSAVQFRIPRLCERREDLPPLVNHFIRQFSEKYAKGTMIMSPGAWAFVRRHPWPGNIRELENAIDYACMVTEGSTIDVTAFPEYLREEAAMTTGYSDFPISMADAQYQHAMRILEGCNGNRARAAEVLGIGRATLYRLLARNARTST